MYLDGAWYAIDLGVAPSTLPAADRLDVSRLQDLILTPLLKIGDVRSDKRIDFVGGARGTSELELRVRDGRAAVAYRYVNGVGLAAGDPVGEEASAPDAVQRFIARCDAHGWRPAASRGRAAPVWPDWIRLETRRISSRGSAVA